MAFFAVLLQIRTTVLLGNPRWLKITFAVLDLACLAVLILLQCESESNKVRRDCFSHSSTDFIGKEFDDIMWIPLMCMEFITLCFTLKRTYNIYVRSYGGKIVASQLLEVLIRDNILYFLM